MWAKIKSWFTPQEDHWWKYRRNGKHRKCLVCCRTERRWMLESGICWVKRNPGYKGVRCSEH